MSNTPQLRTPGVIADQLGQPVARVIYAIRKLRIRPIGRAGTLRLFDQHASERVRAEIERIDRCKREEESCS